MRSYFVSVPKQSILVSYFLKHHPINLPENCQVERLPEKYAYFNDFVAISYEVKQLKNKIKVKGIYKFKKAVYEDSNYSKIKKNLVLLLKK